MRKILIGGAWVYANGSLHIGHIASLLPGDVLARYHRMLGDDVYYVSGSDCYGTPITIRAKKEGKSPEEICEAYHEEFTTVFEELGFHYDRYTKTTAKEHKEFVKEFHERLYEGGYVYEKAIPQAYCDACGKSLVDRMVVGTCVKCGEPTKGDQCDACGEVLELEDVVGAKCSECGRPVSLKETKQLYLAISGLENELRGFLGKHPGWRKNAVAFTKRYIEEGLRDRAITRSIDWGIPIPKDGYGDKRIYIWTENVLGYLSASAKLLEERGLGFSDLWDADRNDVKHYYVHGKDNIPFHTIILPSLLLGHGGNLRLPDEIVSSEHVTLEGEKVSTSGNWAIWGKDLVKRYNPDAVRYFFLVNGPENRDTDFSWREFVERNNGELLGCYGNLIHRTLAFIAKYMDGRVPKGALDDGIRKDILALYVTVGKDVESGRFKRAVHELFDFARYGNKYFDEWKPWETRKTNKEACKDTIYNCVQIIANLAILLYPFLPFSSEKVMEWLDLKKEWNLQYVTEGRSIPEITILFERLEKEVADRERERLRKGQILSNVDANDKQ